MQNSTSDKTKTSKPIFYSKRSRSVLRQLELLDDLPNPFHAMPPNIRGDAASGYGSRSAVHGIRILEPSQRATHRIPSSAWQRFSIEPILGSYTPGMPLPGAIRRPYFGIGETMPQFHSAPNMEAYLPKSSERKREEPEERLGVAMPRIGSELNRRLPKRGGKYNKIRQMYKEAAG